MYISFFIKSRENFQTIFVIIYKIIYFLSIESINNDNVNTFLQYLSILRDLRIISP